MYITGTSTRKVEKVARKLKVDSLSKDQVLRLCAVVEDKVDALLARGCSPLRFAYLFLNATYVSWCMARGLHRGDRRRRRRSAPLCGVHVREFKKLRLLARVSAGP